MDAEGLFARCQEEILRGRAKRFARDVGLANRQVEDYKESPDLLLLDLAWTINEALSAADVAGVDLDLETAVETGKLLHLRGVVGSD